jgi:hypothetical protein
VGRAYPTDNGNPGLMMELGQTKVCKKCQEEKALEEFHCRKSTLDGRQPYCKKCKSKWAKESNQIPGVKIRHKENLKKWRLKKKDLLAKDPSVLAAKKEEERNRVAELKKCNCCNRLLAWEEFPARKDSPDGRRGECRECRSKQTAEYNKIPEVKTRKAALAKVQSQIPEVKVRRAAQAKAHNQLPKVKVRIEAYKKGWYAENKKEVIKRTGLWTKEKRISDPYFKFCQNARHRYKAALRNMVNGKKVGSAVKALKCTREEFVSYFGGLLAERGWTFEQHGFKGWHYDHIIPLCRFDLNDEEQFAKAFHYTNLQPLWWDENLSKGVRV